MGEGPGMDGEEKEYDMSAATTAGATASFSMDKDGTTRRTRRTDAVNKSSTGDYNPAASEPKVFAPYQNVGDSAPRQVLVARLKAQHSLRGIESLLLELGVDLANNTLDGEPIDTKLPLEAFDDQEFEVYATPKDWLALGMVDGEQMGIPCKSLKARGASKSWQDAKVLDYEDDSKKYVIEWLDSGMVEKVQRLRVLFQAEDPVNFARRLRCALKNRKDAGQLVMYNLFVDCMPVDDDMPTLDLEQMNRVQALSLSTRRLAQKDELYTRTLISEVKLDYSRTMNKIIFDLHYHANRDQFETLSLPPPLKTAPARTSACVELDLATTNDDPEAGTDYSFKLDRFMFQTLYTRDETYNVMELVSKECMKLKERCIYVVSYPMPQRLDDFVSSQSTHLKNCVDFMNDNWSDNIKQHIETGLGNIEKGWFKLHETNTEVYNMSKLKNFFTLVNFKMQDSLRFCTERSLRLYCKMLDRTDATSALCMLDLSIQDELNVIELKVKPETFGAEIARAFTTALQSMQNIVQVERRVMDRLFWSSTPMLASVLEDEPFVVKDKAKFVEYLADSCEPVNNYVAGYSVYTEFLAQDFQQTIDELVANREGEDDGSLDYIGLLLDIKNQVTEHRAAAEESKKNIPDDVTLGIFKINCKKVKHFIVTKHEKFAQQFLDFFAEKVGEAARSYTAKYDKIYQHLCKRISNIEELTEMEQYMEDVPNLTKELQGHAQKMLDEFETLSEFGFYLSRQDFNARWNLFGYPRKLVDKIDALVDSNAVKKEEYLDTMKEEQRLFDENLRNLASEVGNLSRFNKPEQVDQTAAYVRKIKDKIANYKEQALKFNSREGLFENDITEYTQLGTISRNFEPYSFLWETADSWKKNHEMWMHGKFTDINAEKLDTSVSDYFRKLVKAEKVFTNNKVEECAKIARSLRAQVEEFKPLGPLVIALRNPGMRKRHWSELSLKINKVIQPDDTFTLTTVIELGLTEQVDLCTKIGETAAKEYQIEKALNQMQEAWNDINLEIEAYRNTGTSILKGADEIIQLLDEHITMTQAMNFSSFKKPFEERIAAWDKQLSTVSEVIDEWLAVQRSWLYLQPIFDSDDIKKQLPTESKRFLTVDKNWRQTLMGAQKNPKCISFCDSSKLLEKFEESSKFLDMVQKGANSFIHRSL